MRFGRILDVGKFWLMFVIGVPFLARPAASPKEDGRA